MSRPAPTSASSTSSARWRAGASGWPAGSRRDRVPEPSTPPAARPRAGCPGRRRSLAGVHPAPCHRRRVAPADVIPRRADRLRSRGSSRADRDPYRRRPERERQVVAQLAQSDRRVVLGGHPFRSDDRPDHRERLVQREYVEGEAFHPVQAGQSVAASGCPPMSNSGWAALAPTAHGCDGPTRPASRGDPSPRRSSPEKAQAWIDGVVNAAQGGVEPLASTKRLTEYGTSVK